MDIQHRSTLSLVLGILATLVIIFAGTVVTVIAFFICYLEILPVFLALLPAVGFILLIVIIWWGKYRKKLFFGLVIYVAVLGISVVGYFQYEAAEDAKTISQNQAINVEDYKPFQAESKIVRLPHEASLKLEGDLPIVDGAAALLPVYAAFVEAVYPKDIQLLEEGSPFLYNNTVGGYNLITEGNIDIFFGAYPSEEQLAYAEQNGVELLFTPIGKEGFVFFVNEQNTIHDLTSEQVKGIYSGEIRSWSEVGGINKDIVAYQRNNGSGSQSMLIRFMDNTPLMVPPVEKVNNFMTGIINSVADYKNNSDAIGFSFRYYTEEIIKNYNIKLLSIDGVRPTADTISSGNYPITSEFYAVTRKDNENPNVSEFINWILSEEGQQIIKETGYAALD